MSIHSELYDLTNDFLKYVIYHITYEELIQTYISIRITLIADKEQYSHDIECGKRSTVEDNG